MSNDVIPDFIQKRTLRVEQIRDDKVRVEGCVGGIAFTVVKMEDWLYFQFDESVVIEPEASNAFTISNRS